MNVEIPMVLPSVANQRLHWAAKARQVKQQRNAVAWVLGNRPRPPLPVVVTLTRVAPRTLDGDNLQGAFKGVRDQVAAWLGCDDADPRVTWAYAQTKGKPPRVVVSIRAPGGVA